MGEMVFRKVQYAKELKTAHGTAVAATDMFMGKITVPVDRKPVYPELPTGRRARAQKGHVRQIHVDGLSLSMEHGLFQMAPFLFSIGLKGDITPVEQTVGEGDYLWDFTPSLTGKNNPDSATVEYGDDDRAYEIEYVMAKGYKISGTVGDDASVQFDADCFGKQITPTNFTGGIIVPDVELMAANLANIYIDDSWANLGNTKKTGLLQSYSFDILTGVHAKFHGEGVKTMTGHGEGYIDAIATFTFESGTAANGYFDDFRAGTPRAIRLELLGAQIGDGENHSLIIDLYGEFEQVVPLGSERNGNNLHTAIFHMLDDAQATPHSLAVQVVTDRNTI